MVVDAVEQWRAHKREVASRKVRLPPQRTMVRKVRWLSGPKSVLSKAFLPELTKMAGQILSAQEIADGVGAAYNVAVRKLPPRDGTILMVLLGQYPQEFIDDKEVGRMVREHIDFVFEQAALRRNRSRVGE